MGWTTDETRMTRTGAFLRSTSLDELPTLWNVIKGDMSLVGPRPLLMEYLDEYTAEQARRMEVAPGITGLAQINGRNEQSWASRFAYDLHYVDNCSLKLDICIILRTVWTVLRREGINSKAHVTMPLYRANPARPDANVG